MLVKNKVALWLKEGTWKEELVVFLHWETDVLKNRANSGREHAGLWELGKCSYRLRNLVAKQTGGSLVFNWFANKPNAQFLKEWAFAMECHNVDHGVPAKGVNPAFLLDSDDDTLAFPPYKQGTAGSLLILESANALMRGKMYQWIWRW
jgi:hypothetical protein